MERYKIVVAMNPLVFHDNFVKKPSRDMILELLLGKLQNGEIDEHFIIITEKEA